MYDSYSMGYLGYYASEILLIPAIIFTLVAQAKVKSAFKKFSNIRNDRGLTGAQAARMVLDANGLNNVQIERVSGSLTDHYDPRTRVLRLSDTVCNVPSIAAISVACHEAGHAIQHANGYAPLKIRNSMVPVVNFASKFSWIMIIVGIALLAYSGGIGDLVFNIGVVMLLAVIVFHTVTLPVEFNASSRAIEQMINLSIIDEDEERGAKKVLHAAALTYVAALAVAIGNLLRVFAIKGSRD